MLVAAIWDAGCSSGRDGVMIALDPAASEFRDDDGTYLVGVSTRDLVGRYAALVEEFTIWSIEDGVGEDDTGLAHGLAGDA